MTDLDRDVRIIRRNLAKGFLSKKAVSTLLAELPDVSEQAEYFDPEAEDEEVLPETSEAA